MSTHSPISPSAAHRWRECVAAPAMEEGLPDKTSQYAVQGSVAHDIAAQCLLAGTNADAYLGTLVTLNEGEAECDEEMVENVNLYLNTLRYTYGFDRDGDKVCLVETPVPFGAALGQPGHFGTVDALIIGDGEIQIHDLKYGKGVEVEAYDNPQLMLYALGALEEYIGLFDLQRVRLVIHQPRLDSVSEHVMHLAELVGGWGTETAERARIALALMKDRTRIAEYLKPGDDQCRWCKAKAICPALRGEVVSTVFQAEAVTPADFSDLHLDVPEIVPPQAPADWLALSLAKVSLIEDWCTAVRTEAKARLEHGKPVPGFKLVAGRAGARKWSNEGEVEAILKDSMRYPADVIYKQTLHNPTQIEKALADSPRRWERLAPFITRAEGAPVVVPESDARDALPSLAFTD